MSPLRSIGGSRPECGGRSPPDWIPAAQAEARRHWLVWPKSEADSRRAQRRLTYACGTARPARVPTQGSRKRRRALRFPQFMDEAQRWGIVFTFDNGQSDHRHLPETMSGGVALLDFDGDGWIDIYAVQGGPFPPRPDRSPPFGDRLFRNQGDGRFEDVTVSSGLAALTGGYGHAAAVGDYDNDGRPDVLVTRWRSVCAVPQPRQWPV